MANKCLKNEKKQSVQAIHRGVRVVDKMPDMVYCRYEKEQPPTKWLAFHVAYEPT